jgi:diguanylate cyclase
LKYSQDRSQSLTVARAALRLIAKQPAALNPHTYAVWFEHAANRNASLSRAIETRLSAGIAIDTDEASWLYRTYVERHETAEQERIAAVLSAILHEIVRGARSAGADLGRLKETLEERQHELAGALEQMALRAVVSSLIGDTEEVRAATLDLLDRMDSNARELLSLRSRLIEAETDALVDPLTKLANRRGFEREVTALQKVDDGLAHCALLFIDIDHFKRLNDAYGHMLGDKVLCAIGELIRQSIKGRDLAARLGGEEFVVLLTATTMDGARAVAEQLRHAIARCIVRRKDGEALGKITVSIGIALADANESIAGLVERADEVMYAAKRGGRDRVAFARLTPEADAEDLLLASSAAQLRR